MNFIISSSWHKICKMSLGPLSSFFGLPHPFCWFRLRTACQFPCHMHRRLVSLFLTLGLAYSPFRQLPPWRGPSAKANRDENAFSTYFNGFLPMIPHLLRKISFLRQAPLHSLHGVAFANSAAPSSLPICCYNPSLNSSPKNGLQTNQPDLSSFFIIAVLTFQFLP